MSQAILLRGVDADSATLDFAGLKTAGYDFVIRYVAPSVPGKSVGSAEVAACHQAGLDMGFVYEVDGTSWRGGKSAGMADATVARAYLASLGAPAETCVYYAIDEPVDPSQLPTVIDWIAGLYLASPPYGVGVYGQYSVMAAARQVFPQVYTWQTVAWSNGLVYGNLDLFQDLPSTFEGVGVDVDNAYLRDFGQWPAHAAPPPPPAQPKEIDMFVLKVKDHPAVYLYDGACHHITSPANETALKAVMPTVEVDQDQFAVLNGEKPF
jgi:hypothetical protein